MTTRGAALPRPSTWRWRFRVAILSRGAAGLSVLTFVLAITSWVAAADHVAGPTELAFLMLAIAQAASLSGVIWLFYVAIEPYVRRNWPESLVSWTRLHSGQFRDPLVASHVLAGVAAGLFFERIVLKGAPLMLSSALRWVGGGTDLASAPANLAPVLMGLVTGFALCLMLLIFVVLIRLLSKRLWVADVAGALVFSVMGVGTVGPIAGPVIMVLGCLGWLWMFRRLGLLPLLVGSSLLGLRGVPFVLTGWLATRSIALHAIPVVIAAAALWAVVAAQPRRAAEHGRAA